MKKLLKSLVISSVILGVNALAISGSSVPTGGGGDKAMRGYSTVNIAGSAVPTGD
jgi:hypothetical protein